jgi:acetylornithine deacetylase
MPAAGKGARRAIAARAGDWTLLLQDLIRIPSCFEAEHAIVARVCEHVAATGLTPVLVPIDAAALRRNPDAMEPISEVAGRNNIVVRLPGRGGGRSLILNCHLDTQPAGDPGEWTHPPFSGHIDAASNAIFGRGAMDDKAGVAICLGLMRTLVEQRLRLDGDLVFQSPATAAWHVWRPATSPMPPSLSTARGRTEPSIGTPATWSFTWP